MEKRALTKTLLMERVIILAFAVFIGHGHLQYAEDGWEESPRLRYYVYFVPFYVSHKNVITFSFGTSFLRSA